MRALRLLALVLAATAVSLLLAEGVLRVLDLPRRAPPPAKDEQFFVLGDGAGGLGYVNKPNARLRFRYASDPRGYFDEGSSVVHATNSMGFRGAEFPPPSPCGLRIAFLGDSFTFGEGVKDAHTFAEQTANALRASGDRAVVPLNFGVGGYNAEQAARMLAQRALLAEPGAVVLGYSANDVRSALFSIGPRGELRRRPAPDGRGAVSGSPWHLVRLVSEARHGPERTRRAIATLRAAYAEDGARWAATRAALDAMGATCAERGMPCVAVVFPLLFSLDAYPLAEEHARIVGALRGAGFRVVDLLPALRGLEARDLWVHPGDHHPNEQVHALAGARIAEEIAATCPGPCGCAP